MRYNGKQEHHDLFQSSRALFFFLLFLGSWVLLGEFRFTYRSIETHVRSGPDQACRLLEYISEALAVSGSFSTHLKGTSEALEATEVGLLGLLLYRGSCVNCA